MYKELATEVFGLQNISVLFLDNVAIGHPFPRGDPLVSASSREKLPQVPPISDFYSSSSSLKDMEKKRGKKRKM